MAYVDELYDPRKDRQLGQQTTPAEAPASAPAAGSSSGGGATLSPAPTGHGSPGTGYVNLSNYIQANQGGAQGMANAIGGDVSKLGAQATADAGQLQGELAHSTAATAGAVDPALQAKLGPEAAQASMAAQALQSPGGIGALMTNHYGQQGGYGSGMRGFDSFLAGNAGGDQFQQLGNQYGGLDKYVSGLGASYSPQVVSNPGGPGMKGGPAGASPPGMVSGFQPPHAPAAPASAQEDAGAAARRKRRAF